LNGKFLRFRRDGVSISYTVICLSHFDFVLPLHKLCKQWKLYIVNIFKKMIDFSFEKRKNFLFNPVS
jgi:hypothetical protein